MHFEPSGVFRGVHADSFKPEFNGIGHTGEPQPNSQPQKDQTNGYCQEGAFVIEDPMQQWPERGKDSPRDDILFQRNQSLTPHAINDRSDHDADTDGGRPAGPTDRSSPSPHLMREIGSNNRHHSGDAAEQATNGPATIELV